MPRTAALPLDQVIAGNLRRLRAERGWRQADVADRMKALGIVAWSSNKVGQVEALRRGLTSLELAALCLVFERPLSELFAGDDEVELPSGGSVALRRIRQAITEGRTDAEPVTVPGLIEHAIATGQGLEVYYVPSEDEQRAAARLGTDVGTVQSWCQKVYDTPDIRVARDRLLGDQPGVPARTVQARRGHAMRQVVEEIRRAMEGAAAS